jgi:hypothetical protein
MKKAICINPYGSETEYMAEGEGFNTTKGETYLIEKAYGHEEETFVHVHNLEGVWLETSKASRFQDVKNT